MRVLAAVLTAALLTGCLPNEIDVAPDGRIALALGEGGSYEFVTDSADLDVYVLSADLSSIDRLTDDDVRTLSPRFALGGRAVLYVEDGPDEVLWLHDLATRERRRVATVSRSDVFPRVSPGGGRVSIAVENEMKGENDPEPCQVEVLDLAEGTSLRRLRRVLPVTAWVAEDRLLAVEVVGRVEDMAVGRLTVYRIPDVGADQVLAHGLFLGVTPLSVRPDGQAATFASLDFELPIPHGALEHLEGAALPYSVHEVSFPDGRLGEEAPGFLSDYDPAGKRSHAVMLPEDRSRIVYGEASIEVAGFGYHRFVGPGRLLHVDILPHEAPDRPGPTPG